MLRDLGDMLGIGFFDRVTSIGLSRVRTEIIHSSGCMISTVSSLLLFCLHFSFHFVTFVAQLRVHGDC